MGWGWRGVWRGGGREVKGVVEGACGGWWRSGPEGGTGQESSVRCAEARIVCGSSDSALREPLSDPARRVLAESEERR